MEKEGVLLYQGGIGLVKKSGIGTALRHQEQALRKEGVPIERKGVLEFIQMAENYPEYQFFWFGSMSPLLMRGI